MQFNIPPSTLTYWERTGSLLMTDADLALLEQRLQAKAPPGYVAFMKRYGAVELDTLIDSYFSYRYTLPDRTEVKACALAFIKTAERALVNYTYLMAEPALELPPNLLPFAQDYGEGQILIEFGAPTERIFYWSPDTHDWETGETRLGFVAHNMYDFINNLRRTEFKEEVP